MFSQKDVYDWLCVRTPFNKLGDGMFPKVSHARVRARARTHTHTHTVHKVSKLGLVARVYFN